MPATARLDLAQRIQQLLDQRQEHLTALELIKQTLARINAALKPAPTGEAPAAAEPGAAAPRKGGRRGKRRRFPTTGVESVVEFIRQNKNPTTQEIKQHWKDEGRGGDSDNVLTLLVKAKKLKRERLKDQRGSRYSLP